MDSCADWKIDNGLVIDKITNRIASIEKRLLEVDKDPVEEMIKLRGELEGLNSHNSFKKYTKLNISAHGILPNFNKRTI